MLSESCGGHCACTLSSVSAIAPSTKAASFLLMGVYRTGAYQPRYRTCRMGKAPTHTSFIPFAAAIRINSAHLQNVDGQTQAMSRHTHIAYILMICSCKLHPADLVSGKMSKARPSQILLLLSNWCHLHQKVLDYLSGHRAPIRDRVTRFVTSLSSFSVVVPMKLFLHISVLTELGQIVVTSMPLPCV